MVITLTSHNYPNYYPRNAYVLWIFQYNMEDTTDIVYLISFDQLYIDSNDYLRIGSGSDPRNSTGSFKSYGNYYYGYPSNFYIPAGDMFVEFDADSRYHGRGFLLNITVRKFTGIHLLPLPSYPLNINAMYLHYRELIFQTKYF